MVHFLTTRGHEYTVEKLVRREMQGEPVPRCSVESYDQFFSKQRVPSGVYIFTDIERMTPWELRLAAEAYAILCADRRCRVLNNPARAMSRYELLRNLEEQGINDFGVIRADECRWPPLYPVFLRYEQDHARPLSTELLNDREALRLALEKAQFEGTSRRGLLIVGYAAEPFDGPWFRKFNSFRIGDEVFAHHVVIEDSWNVKYGNETVILPEEYKLAEQRFARENWHADILRKAFCIGGIDYGRADWGLVAGKPQIYEINTNPYVSADPGTQNPTRRATMAFSSKKLCQSLAALETGTGDGTVRMDGKLLSEWRKGRKWYERPERRP